MTHNPSYILAKTLTGIVLRGAGPRYQILARGSFGALQGQALQAAQALGWDGVELVILPARTRTSAKTCTGVPLWGVARRGGQVIVTDNTSLMGPQGP